MSTAKSILLTVFSAGGIGTYHNADYVGSLVKAAIPGVKYKAYADSGWILDTPSYSPEVPQRQIGQSILTNFRATFNEACMDIYKTSNEQWRCFFGLYAYPFIKTEMFWAQHQFDSPFVGVYPPFNDSTNEYAHTIQQTFLLQLSPFNSVFQPNCFCHGVEAYSDRWVGITVNGISPSTAVWNWFINDKPSRNVDTCVPVNCNPTCVCTYESK